MDPAGKDKEVLDSVDTLHSGVQKLADETTITAMHIVDQVNTFKRKRVAEVALYRTLYAGKVKPKYRQPFNVVIPVFAGSMDTLAADFNDDLALEFDPQEPADHLTTRKLNALWDMEVGSLAPNAMFAFKTRTDRHNALFTGRGFMMNYGVSVPEYCNHFEVYELEEAIFQPQGGGIMEQHLYKGRDNLIRSAHQLESSPSYNQSQVKELISRAANTDHYPFDTVPGADSGLTKYKAMGMSPESADYVGEQLFRLVEMAITIRGEEYYIVYSPWYGIWVRFEKLKDIFSAGMYPATSWATHEDNRNFLSKSYADDMYGVADAVHTLFNQELTNREKRNYQARGYDIDMFPDVAKLDAAQTRPDALVPVTVPNGKRVEDGIFTFETAQLQGTIDLTNWMLETNGRSIGVTDLSQGGVQNVSKKATVVFAEQQSISKRLLLRSSPYTEAMGRIGKLFIQSAKDHLPAEKAIRRLGIQGEGWDMVIRRTDLDMYGDVDVKVKSSAIEMRNSQLKKDARAKVLGEIMANTFTAPLVNPHWVVEESLRSIAEFDDAEIAVAMDTKNYGSKEETAYAHRAIQEVQAGRKPQPYYGATTLFMQIIVDFASNNRETLKDKYDILMQFAMDHQQIAADNLARKANEIGGTPAIPGDPTTPQSLASPATPTTDLSPQTAVRSTAQRLT
jgi:hypothetical protein